MQYPDNERLSWAIEAATGIESVKLTYHVLKKLPDALRDNEFHVNVVLKKLHHSVLVYDVVPVTEERICGAAIDIGTTTVSAVILDLRDGKILAKASAGNGQIRYGADGSWSYWKQHTDDISGFPEYLQRGTYYEALDSESHQ